MLRMTNQRDSWQHAHSTQCLGQTVSSASQTGCHFMEKLMSQLTKTVIIIKETSVGNLETSCRKQRNAADNAS